MKPTPVIVLRIADGVPKHARLAGVIRILPLMTDRAVPRRPFPLLQGAACQCMEWNVASYARFRLGSGIGRRWNNTELRQRTYGAARLLASP